MTNQKINWSQIFALGIPYLIEAIKALREKKEKKKEESEFNLSLTDRQVYLLQLEFKGKDSIRRELERDDQVEYYLLIQKIDTLRIKKQNGNYSK